MGNGGVKYSSAASADESRYCMRLSIIVPVYNVEGYLSACLDSMIYPELDNYEIVIVNDGATDSSPAIAQDYVNRYPRLIRLIHRENGGLGAARNTAIDIVDSEYLMFVDSDDTLAPNAVPEILKRLDEGFDMCIFAMRSVNEFGEEVTSIPFIRRDGVFDLPSCPELLLSAHSACNKIYRRTLFTDTGIRYPGRVWYEDMRTTPKLYLYAGSIVTEARQWYIYLQRSGSITNSANIEKNLEIIDAVEDLTSYYKDCGQYEKYKNELEYSAFYNEFLTGSVRVCLADPRHPAAERLRLDFLTRFPNYRDNPYIQRQPMKHRLLTYLLMHRMTGAVSFIMKLNGKMKNKTA